MNIKELAEQAGFYKSSARHFWYGEDAILKRFAELIRKDEREACAKIADDLERKEYEAIGDPRVTQFKSLIGEAIRSRK